MERARAATDLDELEATATTLERVAAAATDRKSEREDVRRAAMMERVTVNRVWTIDDGKV